MDPLSQLLNQLSTRKTDINEQLRQHTDLEFAPRIAKNFSQKAFAQAGVNNRRMQVLQWLLLPGPRRARCIREEAVLRNDAESPFYQLHKTHHHIGEKWEEVKRKILEKMDILEHIPFSVNKLKEKGVFEEVPRGSFKELKQRLHRGKFWLMPQRNLIQGESDVDDDEAEDQHESQSLVPEDRNEVMSDDLEEAKLEKVDNSKGGSAPEISCQSPSTTISSCTPPSWKVRQPTLPTADEQNQDYSNEGSPKDVLAETEEEHEELVMAKGDGCNETAADHKEELQKQDTFAALKEGLYELQVLTKERMRNDQAQLDILTRMTNALEHGVSQSSGKLTQRKRKGSTELVSPSSSRQAAGDEQPPCTSSGSLTSEAQPEADSCPSPPRKQRQKAMTRNKQNGHNSPSDGRSLQLNLPDLTPEDLDVTSVIPFFDKSDILKDAKGPDASLVVNLPYVLNEMPKVDKHLTRLVTGQLPSGALKEYHERFMDGVMPGQQHGFGYGYVSHIAREFLEEVIRRRYFYQKPNPSHPMTGLPIAALWELQGSEALQDVLLVPDLQEERARQDQYRQVLVREATLILVSDRFLQLYYTALLACESTLNKGLLAAMYKADALLEKRRSSKKFFPKDPTPSAAKK